MEYKSNRSLSLLLVILLSTPAVLVAQTRTTVDTIVPSDRTIKWKAGDDSTPAAPGDYVAGIPGGIPTNRTNVINVVTDSRYRVDNTGQSDASIGINKAITEANDFDVIFLPAGTYRIDSGVGPYGRSNVTLRGAGPNLTILDCRTSATCASSSGITGNAEDLKFDKAIGGVTKGSKTLSLSNVSTFSVGEMARVVVSNDYSLPVVHPYGFRKIRFQTVIVEAVDRTNNTITIDPPLMAKFDPNSTYIRHGEFRTINKNNGLEDFTIDGSHANTTPKSAVGLQINYGSWLKNVEMKGVRNHVITLFDNIRSELRENVLHHTTKDFYSANGSGLLMERDSSCLIENNIFHRLFPPLEVNETSMGNVVAYNMMYGTAIANMNHGAHNSYNLYEGNITDVLESDGYYGSDSEETIFRNWVGNISLKRWSRNFNIIGNLLSNPGYAITYNLGKATKFMFESVLGTQGDDAFNWLMNNGNIIDRSDFSRALQGSPLTTGDLFNELVNTGYLNATGVVQAKTRALTDSAGLQIDRTYNNYKAKIYEALIDDASHHYLRPCNDPTQGCYSDSGNFLDDNLDEIRAGYLASNSSPHKDKIDSIMVILSRGISPFEFGRPNIGNVSYSGYAQPSKGKYWDDWNPTSSLTPGGLGITGTLVSKSGTRAVFHISNDRNSNTRLYAYAHRYCNNDDITDINHPAPCVYPVGVDWGSEDNFNSMGTEAYDYQHNTLYLNGYPNTPLPEVGTTVGFWPRSEGFQELDLDVEGTLINKGNWLPSTKGGGQILSAEAINVELPKSLFRSAAPSYWPSDLTWPPFDSQHNPNQSLDAIPAGQRWLKGGYCGAAINECDRGTPTEIRSEKPPNSDFKYYYWRCVSQVGEVSDQCSLPVSSKDGVCGTDLNSCVYGTPADQGVGLDQKSYEWTCQGDLEAASVRCSYLNQPPTLKTLSTTFDLTHVTANDVISLSTVSTDDHGVNNVKLFTGNNLEIPSTEYKVSKPYYNTGTKNWGITVDWTPTTGGDYHLLQAKVVDDLGVLSNFSSVIKKTLSNDLALVDRWRLNDGIGLVAKDISAAKNDAEIISLTGQDLSSNNKQIWVAGRDGVPALSLDGTVGVQAVRNLDSYPMTGCAWIYPHIANSSSYVTSNVISLTFFNLFLSANYYPSNADEYRLDLYNNKGSISSTDPNNHNQKTIKSESWNLVCASVDLDFNATLFINGAAAGTGSLGNSVDFVGDRFRLGFAKNGSSFSGIFNGLMSDIRIYNRALQESEVQELYHPTIYPIDVIKSGLGVGTVVSSNNNINCGANCSDPAVPVGTSVTLTATSAPGSIFVGWSSGGCSGTGSCVVTKEEIVTANFRKLRPAPPIHLRVVGR